MTHRLAAALAIVVVTHAVAAGEPLRLRGDALAIAPSPAGLLTLEADGAASTWLSAEAMVWFGQAPARDGDATGDALVIAIRAHTRGDRASLRLGRFVATAGALRPTHLDGLAGRARLPYRFDAELFAGVPVVAGGARMWDWIAGGRVSRRLGDWGAVGIAALERREQGRRAAQELGLDAGGALGRRTDVASRLAIDLLTGDVAEVAVTASRRQGAARFQLHAGQRAPSHLVPATSLFSVLGDVPSQVVGGVVTWRVAPRLDLIADLAARRIDGDIAPELVGRATLRLDDRGAGMLGAELRRAGVTDHAWTGVRATARIPVAAGIAIATELELVRPDDATAGSLWPWGLVAVSGRRGDWDAAVAIEASASAEYRRRLDVLAQLGRRWGAP